MTMYGYVPDGLTAEEWKKIKAKEAEKKANLGKVGPR
jgi:muconolactone delta-isomerase